MLLFTNQKINKNKRYFCVSRPRRFGKSMAAAMLAAYYSQGYSSKKLFEGLKALENKEFTAHLNQYDVTYLNIQQFLSGSLQLGELPKCIETEVMRELKAEYGDCFTENSLGLSNALEQIYQSHAQAIRGFVFILKSR